jgi:hypothetical protein
LNESLDTAFSLYDQDSRFADGVCNVFGANVGIKHVPRLKDGAVLSARNSIPHLNSAVKYGKNFFTIVDVPLVRLIRPMKARSDAAHVGNICGAPRAVCFECATPKYFHAVLGSSFNEAVPAFH